MSELRLTIEQVATLSALACAMIPADEKDDGVAPFDPGRRIADKIEADPNPAPYLKGLRVAENAALEEFDRPVAKLDARSLEKLLGMLRDGAPALFKLIRAEVCGLYLNRPPVWKRIGFPGPSIEKGGYPDFDQPQ